MEQTINVTDLDTMDNGSITCSFSINNVDYHSEPLNLLVSGESINTNLVTEPLIG